ncbi:hypothetical protein ANOM_003289 [Aspergillus nomiae NRRL 13137]|uniref:Myb-like DNA-binding domain-containing protein n=1 Tax=Aspergillus nomiae NRRL (strain ATCC 15546 / NRRL 13137 / CBS 260.88 / M93) TaxID=1509407 RepID=A0A0L1JA79_ASPN3|nr:uncharacterized protein ANOM_003289 [Aspergillus nomiae NRRL 13137]KNG88649.1 hypothetical protein ANOM_003289 [Aspergillus nomiae NRRL 13137]
MKPANPRPKAKTDEHLVFLYLCLVNSGGVNNIDFNAVAVASNINVPAARMRWARLKARIEKEMADGSGDPNAGEPSAASTPTASPAKTASPSKKRCVKRKNKSEPEDDNVAENNDESNPTAEAS